MLELEIVRVDIGAGVQALPELEGHFEVATKNVTRQSSAAAAGGVRAPRPVAARRRDVAPLNATVTDDLAHEAVSELLRRASERDRRRSGPRVAPC